MALHGLALCAGAGGLELGLGLALDHLGPGYRMVGAVERDAYAAACLVARMADEALDQAPVWDDLATFDGRPWRGRVDLVSGGLPCQPFSTAGSRAGLDDPRHLWPHARRIIAEVGPRFVFLENVPDVVRAGWLPGVLADLAELGFDAEWGVLGASDVGAPHRRRRFWLLAYRDGGGCEGIREQPPGARGGLDRDPDGPGRAPGYGGADVAYADGERGGARIGSDQGSRSGTESGGSGAAVWPPGPDDRDGWERWIAEGGPEPSVRRDADGLAHRLDRLHTIGNGVVPLVAATAFIRLARRAGIDFGG